LLVVPLVLVVLHDRVVVFVVISVVAVAVSVTLKVCCAWFGMAYV